MAVCPRCGHHNRPGSLICEKCIGSLHGSSPEGTSTTKQLDNIEGVSRLTSTGQSRFDPDDQLVIQVRSSHDPIVLKQVNRIILGRTGRNGRREPDIDFAPYDALTKGVSHLHAAIGFRGNALTVVDMGSLNGTYLNGDRLLANREYVLHDGDELWLGRLAIRTYFQRAAIPTTD